MAAELNKPWLSMRIGIILMVVASVLFAAFIAWNAIPSQGTLKGIGTGILFSSFLWAIFFGNIWLNRLLRKKK